MSNWRPRVFVAGGADRFDTGLASTEVWDP
jgi:hypothetical protein